MTRVTFHESQRADTTIHSREEGTFAPTTLTPGMASATPILILQDGITVRRLRQGDEHELARHADNYKIWLNLTDRFPFPYDLKAAEGWLEITSDVTKWQPTLLFSGVTAEETREAFEARQNGSRIPTYYVICDNDKPIGCCGLEFDIHKFPRTAAMGYWLGEEYWGRGIATKVASAMLQWGFDTFPWLVRIEGDAYSWNKASMRVLQKIGMQAEGVSRLKAFKDGKYGDIHLFAKVRDGFVTEVRE